MIDNWGMPLGIFTGIVMVSFLGMAETALLEVGLYRMRRMLAGNNEAADFAPDEQARLLTAVLALRIILILLLGSLATSWAIMINPKYLIGSLVVTTLLMVCVEVGVRRYARAHSEATAAKVLPVLRQIHGIFSPLIGAIFAITSAAAAKKGQLPVTSLKDLHEDILELRSQGVLEDDETQMIQSVVLLGETIAREVMVPRVDMICTKMGTPVREVLETMGEHGYSRIPVYKDSIDEIQGFVHVKDLVYHVFDGDRPIDEEDLREVLVVPGTKKVIEILRDLQAESMALAVVLDEYGGTEGLLTLEDIVEEIVGEITDEYDEEPEEVVRIDDHTALCDAKMILEDVNEQLDLSIPVDDGHETLGGYVYGLLGHVPEAGETVEVDGLKLTVESVNRRRITRVRVENGGESYEENVA